ncbi:glycoside hydrolase family 5 protein [Amycolatopsis sp. cg5]|uniref:glycoside hydrolase family 5 protein n=1 Tax=Amycolatopsis sp. cg5 TaxID=3238802 RepID=UPI0035252D19
MARSRWQLVLTAALAALIAAPAASAAPMRQEPSATPAAVQAAPAGSPVAINGQLHVCGLKLCNQYDKPIQLRGMSTHGLQWYGECYPNKALDVLANEWNADIVRLAMYIQDDGYEDNPRKFTDMVNNLIEEVTKRGMYVLVDWHQLKPGDPNFNTSLAKTFFKEIAAKHKDKVNIIYDIANEPNGVSWSKVKSYADQVIPVIRKEDADSVVFLGTHGWSTFGISDGRDETDVEKNPVKFDNIMYTFHFYAAEHQSKWYEGLKRILTKFPVFITEFGMQNSSGNSPNDFAYAQKYLDLLAANKIGWTNWNFSDSKSVGAAMKPGTCAKGGYSGTSNLKEGGAWVRDRIRTPDNFPTS